MTFGDRFDKCSKISRNDFQHTSIAFISPTDTPDEKTPAKNSSSKRRLSSGSSSSKRGRKSRQSNLQKRAPHLAQFNEQKRKSADDRERAKTFKRWKAHTQSTICGSGNYMRKAAKSILILFLLSHFIVLSEQHRFDTKQVFSQLNSFDIMCVLYCICITKVTKCITLLLYCIQEA